MTDPISKPSGSRSWPRIYFFVLGIMVLQVIIYFRITMLYR